VHHDSSCNTRPTGQFPPTRWSLLLRAGSAPSPEARAALGELCEVYWYPIYAFIRRKGYEHHQALDRTQAFFHRLLERNVLGAVDQSRGRFRSFLLTACRNFLVDGYRSEKRKEPVRVISIDGEDAERRYRIEPVDKMTPDRQFDREWALTLLDHALTRLAREYEAEDNAELFEHLKSTLTQDTTRVPASTIAAQLGMTEAAVHTAAYRLRRRYRKILLEEVSATLNEDLSTEEEIQLLFEAIR
jgi:RNA polymerase sigma factor (sigma-70 family)